MPRRKAALMEALERLFGALGIEPNSLQEAGMTVLEQLEKESIALLNSGGFDNLQQVDRNIKMMLQIRKIIEAYTG